MSTQQIPIAVAYGDGIGPEIMEASINILKAVEAPFSYHPIEVGEKVYLAGHPTGIEDSTWDTIRSCKAIFKAPITTPQGGGFKSLNVTFRTTLGLYANIRPCIAYDPFIATAHPGMDVVIIRENEEDLYSGIEYRHTPDTRESMKLYSRQGCEKIVRFAFEYAKQNNRKKVSCFTKDNIMKFTDGLFHKVYDAIASEYPDIETEHWIIDIGTAKLADTPDAFDVIVLPNLYGDILSDVAAQICGSIGLVGTSCIGTHGAMFEAIHGSAPDIAGKDLANPSALILASVQMLVYLGYPDIAAHVHNAWLRTIEEGIHTGDIFTENVSKKRVGTKEFGEAVVKRLGSNPEKIQPVTYKKVKSSAYSYEDKNRKEVDRDWVGVDVFVYSNLSQEQFVENLTSVDFKELQLSMITNRGVRIYPDGHPETYCVDQFRCRFESKSKELPFTTEQLIQLLHTLEKQQIESIKIEKLYYFDGEPGFSQPKG